MRSRCIRKNGADPPCESALRFCSTVSFTSSAVISPNLSWNCTPERSLKVQVRSSFEGFHSVASPGRYSNVLGSRMISGSCMQSHSVFSDWLERQANGVSIPHCPTATTRRSPAAPARDGDMNGPPRSAAALVEAPFRNARRLIDWAIVLPPRSPSIAGGVGWDGNACAEHAPVSTPAITTKALQLLNCALEREARVYGFRVASRRVSWDLPPGCARPRLRRA